MNRLNLNLEEKVLIIYANALIHKSYHALPNKLTNKKGETMNAVFGFFSIFLKIIRDLQPQYIITAFDSPGKTFRHDLYKKYKETRQKTPDELIAQIPKVENILQKMGIAVLKKTGMEADDIIATLVKKITPEKEVVVLTGDRDLLQLVGSKTKVVLSKTGVSNVEIYNEKKVRQKYHNLNPSQLIDLKALEGDKADNIPGVKGVGIKTGLKLLKKASSLEEVYSLLKKNKLGVKPNLKKKLQKNKEIAFLSKKLGSLKDDVKLDFKLEKYPQKGYNRKELISIFKSMGFESLVNRL